jgi:hypothetical protein
MQFSTDQWIQIANAVGTWVAGIGTLAAVCTSLWLARRTTRVDLWINVGIYWIIYAGADGTDGDSGRRVECVGFDVVNRGENAVTVTGVGWRVGRRKDYRFVYQNVEAAVGPEPPKRLEHGERATFMFRLMDDWRDTFCVDFLRSDTDLRTLRGYVSTTLLHNEFAAPDKKLLERLATARALLATLQGGADDKGST